MLCLCIFIKLYTNVLVGDVDDGRGYACVGVIFVPYFRFCCEPNTALKRMTSLKEKISFGEFSLFSVFCVIDFLLYRFYFFTSICFRVNLIILLTFLK